MPSSPQLGDSAAAQVVIAVDPHKASWTAVAVDARLQSIGALRVPVSTAGYQQLKQFARAWPHARWAVEGARGLGAPLTTRLAADGNAVLDVPAKLARRVRLLSSGHGRKTDLADALSVGIAAQTAAATPARSTTPPYNPWVATFAARPKTSSTKPPPTTPHQRQRPVTPTGGALSTALPPLDLHAHVDTGIPQMSFGA
jgi:hypothetical protein